MRFEAGASPAKRQQARRAADAVFDSTLGVPHAQVVRVDGGVKAAIRQLQRQPGVAYAQPNYVYEATAAEPPDDTFFVSGDLWGLSDPALPDAGVGALDAWEAGKEGEGEVIAILDTGVDLTHPDLAGNLWENPDSGAEDEHGYDFVDDDPDPDDYNFHGTHVAGTAAATSNNAQGIAGVAPKAQIMAVRVLDGDGSGTTQEIVEGIDYAADNGAEVLNMSLGGPAGSNDVEMEEAIDRAGEADAVVVVAAGNEGADNDTEPHTPCALPNPNLICVAALERSNGALAWFSNYGKESVDIAAPGTKILSAMTDYEAIYIEGFESGLEDSWTKIAEVGSIPWGVSSLHSEGSSSATDSPGVNYGPNSNSQLIKTVPVDLSSERGCRMHFDLRRDIQPLASNGAFRDKFFAGAIGPTGQDGEYFAGSSGGQFRDTEVSISELDGETEVNPGFALFSDATQQFDGAYVDDLKLLCRSESYVDDIDPLGNYVRFQGTSMATPHVAGVVALVRAAEPELGAGEVIDAVLTGASAIPQTTSGKRTATEGIADACKAVAIATEGDIESECLASSEPEPQPELDPSIEEIEDQIRAANPATPPDVTSTDFKDRMPPRTSFQRKPPKILRTRWRRGRAVFRFRSNEQGVTFLCQFDRKRYRKCPARFVRWFRFGRHVLRVRARDAAGNVDPTPAAYRFRVRQVSRRAFRRHRGA